MKKHIKPVIFTLLLVFVFLPPVLTFAGLVPCGTSENPRDCTLCDLFYLLQKVVNYVWYFLLIISPILIIVGAVMILTAGVKPSQVEDGKRVITGTVVGLAIAFLSWTILNIVFLTLAKSPGSEGFPWPWNEIRCTGGGVAPPSGYEQALEQAKYCHVQLAGYKDIMAYEYKNQTDCYQNCRSHCAEYGKLCEDWCCLYNNYDGKDNVCSIIGNAWCRNPAPSGSEKWILNPPPGGADERQKGDASINLTKFLNCMYGKIPGLRINSISDNNLCSVPPTCNPATGAGCVHKVGSCHYGGPHDGPCFGYSNAVDFDTNIECKTILSAAQECDTELGGGIDVYVLWEKNHTHVSINGRSCGCDEHGTSSCGGN